MPLVKWLCYRLFPDHCQNDAIAGQGDYAPWSMLMLLPESELCVSFCASCGCIFLPGVESKMFQFWAEVEQFGLIAGNILWLKHSG